MADDKTQFPTNGNGVKRYITKKLGLSATAITMILAVIGWAFSQFWTVFIETKQKADTLENELMLIRQQIVRGSDGDKAQWRMIQKFDSRLKQVEIQTEVQKQLIDSSKDIRIFITNGNELEPQVKEQNNNPKESNVPRMLMEKLRELEQSNKMNGEEFREDVMRQEQIQMQAPQGKY